MTQPTERPRLEHENTGLGLDRPRDPRRGARRASIAVLVSEVRDRTSDVTEDVSDLNDGVSTMNDELTMLNEQLDEVEARVRGATGVGGTGAEQPPR